METLMYASLEKVVLHFESHRIKPLLRCISKILERFVICIAKSGWQFWIKLILSVKGGCLIIRQTNLRVHLKLEGKTEAKSLVWKHVQ